MSTMAALMSPRWTDFEPSDDECGEILEDGEESGSEDSESCSLVPRPQGQSFDWPLSRTEKMGRVLRLFQTEVHAMDKLLENSESELKSFRRNSIGSCSFSASSLGDESRIIAGDESRILAADAEVACEDDGNAATGDGDDTAVGEAESAVGNAAGDDTAVGDDTAIGNAATGDGDDTAVPPSRQRKRRERRGVNSMKADASANKENVSASGNRPLRCKSGVKDSKATPIGCGDKSLQKQKESLRTLKVKAAEDPQQRTPPAEYFSSEVDFEMFVKEDQRTKASPSIVVPALAAPNLRRDLRELISYGRNGRPDSLAKTFTSSDTSSVALEDQQWRPLSNSENHITLNLPTPLRSRKEVNQQGETPIDLCKESLPGIVAAADDACDALNSKVVEESLPRLSWKPRKPSFRKFPTDFNMGKEEATRDAAAKKLGWMSSPIKEGSSYDEDEWMVA
eukprot:TRINITY_DN114268_c0_g1_i1.p1 TRINITY_DN114268_c0_g1~~TRINITY_DN114268_c0_g1_i1.p1  ORF type:complete len:453 (-),score=110.67 TRINITY_DN114268_c0_g1_i1:5-1363(-)